MMMPANFSAIAENELVYVVGGSAATDWAKTFNTNLVTMVGNSFVKRLINTTLGTMFGGAWGSNNGLLDNFSNEFFPDGQSGLNTVMSAVGVGAAVYQLGTTATDTTIGSNHKFKDVIGTTADGKDILYPDKKVHVFGVDGQLHSSVTNAMDWVKSHI